MMPRCNRVTLLPAVAFATFAILIASSAIAGIGGAPGGNGRPLFEFGLLGSGPLTNPCTPEWGNCTLSAGINGNVIGTPSTFTDTMTWDLNSGITSAGNTCFVASGNGSIVAKKGDEIDFIFNGLLCGDADIFSPSTLNATYIVTGGTGRFQNAVGSGNFTQNNIDIGTEAKSHLAAGGTGVTGPAAIVRFDGLLTAKGVPGNKQ